MDYWCPPSVCAWMWFEIEALTACTLCWPLETWSQTSQCVLLCLPIGIAGQSVRSERLLNVIQLEEYVGIQMIHTNSQTICPWKTLTHTRQDAIYAESYLLQHSRTQTEEERWEL